MGYPPRDLWGDLERLIGRLVILLLAFYLLGSLVGGENFQVWAAGEETMVAGATAGATSLVEKAVLAPPATRGTVTIMLVSQAQAPRAKLLLNGKIQGTFATPGRTLAVKSGDLLEIDGTLEQGLLRFRLVRTSMDVTQPSLGTEVVTKGNIGYLGKVKLQ